MQQQYVMSESALRELFDLPNDDRDRVFHGLKRLAADPTDHGLNVKKLKGRDGVFRLRVGDWRVFFTRGSLVEVQGVRRRQDTTYSASQGTPRTASGEYELSGITADLPPARDEGDDDALDEALARGAEPPEAGLLPRPLTPELLRSWHVPSEHHEALSACRTIDDLCEADVDPRVIDHVFDMVMPGDVDEARRRPHYLVHGEDELRGWVEGEITRLLLRLDPDQEALVARGSAGPTLVRGGPGTGKTVVAIHRALALAEAEPGARVLFATFTNTLARYASELLDHLVAERGLDVELDVRTVDDLARQHAPTPAKPIGGREARATVEALLTNEPDPMLRGLGARYLFEEFEQVIGAQGIDDLATYLRVERHGRRLLLVAEERTKVWRVYTAWRARLKGEKATTWAEIRRRALARANPAYDAVLVDEAQDLTPVALRFLVALARDPKRIHVTADAGQSLYASGFSWRGVHEALDMRGKAHVLRRDHRTTRQIHAATRDLARATGLRLEDDTVPGDREGPRPLVRALDPETPWRDLATLLREQCREARLPLGAVAVLAPRTKLVEEIVFELNQLGLPAELGRDAAFDAPTVKVLPLQSAKGLEFPVVIVVGIDEGVTPRVVADLPDEERAEHRARDARTLFVACTRAMRSLAVVHTRGAASEFLTSLSDDGWRRNAEAATVADRVDGTL